MTVSQQMLIRPGVYEKIAMEGGPDTPWCRSDNQPLLTAIVEDRVENGASPLYRVRAIIPRRP